MPIDQLTAPSKTVEGAGSVLVFLMHNDEVMLQHRDEDAVHSPGMLSGFGGAIELDRDATPEDAVRRELSEEIAGLALVGEPVKIGEIPLKDRTDSNATGAMRVYFARMVHDEVEVLEGQGMVGVAIDGWGETSEASIVPDAKIGLSMLEKHLHENNREAIA